MPTGYTATLDETPNMTTAKWVMESLTRAFGVCATLRDNGDMTEEQIEAHLQERVDEAGSYHIDALKRVGETVTKLSDNPEKFWAEEYAKAVETMQAYNEKSIKEAKEIKTRHDKAIEDLIKLRDNTTDEATRSIANYGLEQLELVKSETESYISTVPTLEKFKEDKLRSINRDIDYHSKNLTEAKARERDRLKAYKTIKSEVNRILSLSQR